MSLFTDCSADATREMLGIMQSYGEIVVCIGSSASNANVEIFLQADCSIAIEPLYPQVNWRANAKCKDLTQFLLCLDMSRGSSIYRIKYTSQ